jgi:CBS domain-containing protein
MAFFIVVDGHLTNHSFDYLDNPSGRRLDPTLVPGKEQTKKGLPVDGNTYAIEIMSKKVHFLEQSSSVDEALELFKKEGIHHLPITKDGVLKGLVSDRDVLWLERFDVTEHNNLDSFMSRTILCCDEETPIEHLAKVMVNEKVSAVPIIGKDSKLVGIVTHHDILRWIYDF